MAHTAADSAVPPKRSVDVPMLLLIAGVAVVAAFLGLNIGGHVLHTYVCWIAMTAEHAALVYWAWRIASSTTAAKPTRRFWRATTIGATAYVVGDLVQLVAIARAPDARSSAIGVPLQSVAVDIGTIVILAALVAVPLARGSSRDRLRFWLDAATVMVAAAAFGWYSSIVPGSSIYTGHADVSAVNDLLFGPVIMLTGAFVVVKVLIGGPRPFSRGAGLLLASAASVEGLAQGLAGTLVVEGRFPAVYALTVIANGLLALGALVQLRASSASGAVPDARARGRSRFSLLPYAAIAATYGLLIDVLVDRRLDLRSALVLTAAVVGIILVIVRQILAFAENAQLLEELDAKGRERDLLAAALRHQAFHDSLTALPNRALLSEHLAAALARARRNGPPTVVMIVDLDDFKPINDRLGHSAGDLVLQEVSRRLATAVRQGDTVARVGGDEFAAVLEGCLGNEITDVAQRILDTVAAPITVGHERVVVGCSIGIAVADDRQSTIEAMLERADAAMYEAKRRGKSAYAVEGIDEV
jgi:diguanylate cyclase (GGDEF)-like protein